MHPITPPALLTADPPVLSWWAGLKVMLPPLMLAALCVWGAQFNYLLFHTLAEVLSIVIALTAMVVATTSLRFTRNHFAVFIAVAIGWCASLDLLHTLTFKGMNLLGHDSADPPTQLWIAARFLQASALLASPLLLQRSVRPFWLHLGFGAVAAVLAALVLSGRFPQAYVEGQGLTPFKIYSEYLIIGMLALTLVLYRRHRHLLTPRLAWSMTAAVVVMMASEFAFTRYVSVYAQANLVGHVLKIFAYWFVYVALVQNTLSEPFGVLARAASTYDAVPDPTVLVSAGGLIEQANDAALRYTRLSADQLIGQSSHAHFHDPSVPPSACPVCSRLSRVTTHFRVEIELGGGARTVECSLAPFSRGQHERLYVEVLRDITERKKMVAERESLLVDLGERIKELRCMRAVAELIEQPDLDIEQLLRGVVAAFPAGMLLPEHARAGIVGTWGTYGDPGPDNANCLEREIEVDGQVLARLRVWYPPGLPGARFLPEEDALIDHIAQHVGQSIERLQAAEQVLRLSRLYEMLSATNRVIVHSRDEAELRDGLFEALKSNGAFPVFFMALTDEGRLPVRLDRTHGIPEVYQSHLLELLNDPQRPYVRLIAESQSGRSSLHVLSDAIEPQPDPWLGYLRSEGCTQRATLPMVHEGLVSGFVVLYGKGLGAFDESQIRLLNEMASDLAFALDNFSSQRRRVEAERRVTLSEHRFREVFDESPLPMQIMSLSTRDVRAINKAHQQWLGYAPQDIPNEQRWFEQAYPGDMLMLATAHWEEDLAQAAAGQTVRSPEIALRCRDGTTRTATGTMTVVGDDVIVAWTDLTDIRRNEQTLRESEQRFRSMIEQTVTGIYVRRDGRYIYVNPRYCELAGWREDELIGRDVLDFTLQDDANLASIRAVWAQLHGGAGRVEYTVPFRRKDGQVIELGLSASSIVWNDGRPATIVMAQDVTERKRAEAQIAEYVRQLEGSMKGTLQAVSNMVELRDPYTAGHERRVGLIAGAIAAELGWEPERCQTLELVGLVHDIGKIAVPAEILTKPSRLTALEMEFIKGHSQAGYEILKDVPFPMPVAEIIRQHHERMDGSGYPRGLKGDEILPEARVVAVADVIESMSAHRPYRAALGLEAALAEVERGRGSLYDPVVVDAAVRLVRDRHYQLPS